MAKHIRDRLDETLRDRSAGDAADVRELAGVADAIGRTATTGVATAAGEARALSALQGAVRARQTQLAGSGTTLDSNGPRIVPFRSRPMLRRAGAMAAAIAIGVAVWVAAPGVREPVYAVFGSSSSSVKAEARLTSPLSPASGEPNDALASGKAKSEQRSSRTRFSLEVQGVQSEPGDYPVNVTHNGATAQVATVHVDSFGFGELELNTQDGLPACPATPVCVPLVVATDTVEVLTPDGTTVVLSGTLASK